jgi:hypothetical protein
MSGSTRYVHCLIPSSCGSPIAAFCACYEAGRVTHRVRTLPLRGGGQLDGWEAEGSLPNCRCESRRLS